MNGDLGSLFLNIFVALLLILCVGALIFGGISATAAMVKYLNDWSDAELAYNQKKWRLERRLRRAKRRNHSADIETVKGKITELGEKYPQYHR